jgi:hypothetical protein
VTREPIERDPSREPADPLRKAAERGAGDAPLSGPLRYSLCARCALAKRITSAKGSVFLLCRAADDDPRLSKYPPQPVLVCARHTS